MLSASGQFQCLQSRVSYSVAPCSFRIRNRHVPASRVWAKRSAVLASIETQEFSGSPTLAGVQVASSFFKEPHNFHACGNPALA